MFQVKYPSRRRLPAFASALLLSAATIPGAQAQNGPPEATTEVAALDVIDDIIVTATRQSTSLQKTPVSVGVLGGDELTLRGQTQLRDLSSSVASFQVPSASTPSLSYLFIRGIGTVSPTYNGAVGIYIDDLYQARVINSGIFGLPDVERIEVLRGPQGTLYGQNTSAGAVKIVSRTPDNETRGQVQASLGNYGQFSGNAYISAPLIEDVLAASIAYAHEQTGGYVYNATRDEKVNRVKTDQARFKLHYTSPSIDGLEASLSLYGLRDRSDNAAASPLNVANPDPYVTYENLDLQIHNNAFLSALNVDYALDEHLTLRSITGYREFRNDPDPWSLDGLAGNLFSWELNLDQQQVSQEFQVLGDFGDLTFTSGAIYYHERFISDRPNVTLGNYGGVISKTVTDSIGLYGQGQYKLTDRLGVTLGLRYYWQEDSYDNAGYASDASFGRGVTRYALTGLKQKNDGLTPKIGLDYQFTDGLFGYASVTRGQKSGGYNPVAGTAAIAAIPIEPEKVTTYDTGLKFNTAGNGVILNVSGFYNDFKNYQSLLSNVVVGGVLVNGSVAINAEKSRTYGVEAELTLRPLEGLEARVAATAMSASFQDFNFSTATGPVSYDGNRLPYTSKYNIGASLAHTLDFGENGTLRGQAEVKHVSDSYSDITNNTHIPAQTFVNLDAQYTTGGGNWTGFVQVRNLFDKTYAVGGLPRVPTIPGVMAANYNPPRTFQVGLRYDF